MKKLIFGILLSFIPVLGMSNERTIMQTEISIRPFEPGFEVTGGVLGAEVQYELNGKQITQDLVSISGDLAEKIVSEANAGLKAAGSTAHYAFDKSSQMLILTGKMAQQLIDENAKKGLKLLKDGSEMTVNGARTVFYNTIELTAVATVKARYALEIAAGVGSNAFHSLYGSVKYVSNKAKETAQDMYSITTNKIRESIEFSKNLVLDGADATLAFLNSTVLFVNDQGVYLYNTTSKNVLKLASMTAEGALRLGNQIETVAVEGADMFSTAAINLIKNTYEKIPRVSVSIEIQ